MFIMKIDELKSKYKNRLLLAVGLVVMLIVGYGIGHSSIKTKPADKNGQANYNANAAAKPANSRDAVRSSQDTLTPGDREMPWRGSARSRPESKRPS